MARRHVSRRSLVLGSGLLVAGIAGGWIASSQGQPKGETLSVTAAFEAARDKEIFLIDIRRPDEWAKTGIGEGASPIDMRREDFIAALDQLTGGDKATAIALICARGVRSRYLSNQLRDAGYQRIIDVPEGMLGSFAGPGWLKAGLPVRAHDA